MSAGTSGTVEVAGVRLSNPDKVLYPEQGVTKRELAAWYEAAAPRMLPEVARRPVTLVRCPTGRQRKCFYQRHAGSGVPAALSEVRVPGFEEPYLYLSDVAGLVTLAQLGVLEVHPWGARIDRPDRPDRVLFDLDPGEGLGFDAVVEGALALRERLSGLGLQAFVKTTGGKGLHVVVPIERRHGWKQAKGFAKALADRLAAERPERYLTRISKAERRGRIFIDYLRNDATSTAVAPYSTRARPGAPVAMPLAWDELTPGLDPAAFDLRRARPRLTRPDPWAEIGEIRQRLPASV